MLDALFSVVMATRANPLIRYQRNSDVCYRFAEKLQAKLNEEQDFIERMSKNTQASTVLLIVDRREDPVTPILN